MVFGRIQIDLISIINHLVIIDLLARLFRIRKRYLMVSLFPFSIIVFFGNTLMNVPFFKKLPQYFVFYIVHDVDFLSKVLFHFIDMPIPEFIVDWR